MFAIYHEMSASVFEKKIRTIIATTGENCGSYRFVDACRRYIYCNIDCAMKWVYQRVRIVQVQQTSHVRTQVYPEMHLG